MKYEKTPPGCVSHVCGMWQVISPRGRRTRLNTPSLCMGLLLTYDMIQRRTRIIRGQKHQGSLYIIGATARICAGFKRGQGRVVRHSSNMGAVENQITPLSSLPSLNQCFSIWNIYTNYLELLLKWGLWCRMSGMGSEILHFKQKLIDGAGLWITVWVAKV